MILKWENDQNRWSLGAVATEYIENSTFDATIGNEYRCYSISVFGDRVTALICDDTGLPYWYPMELFTVTDGSIPDSWEVGTPGGVGTTFQMIVGYPEMARNPSHYDALMEREEEAMAIFSQQSGIAALTDRVMDGIVVEIIESAVKLQLENGDAAYLENRSNQRWVDGGDLPQVGDTVSVVITDGAKYPVSVSSLFLDIESGR